MILHSKHVSLIIFVLILLFGGATWVIIFSPSSVYEPSNLSKAASSDSSIAKSSDLAEADGSSAKGEEQPNETGQRTLVDARSDWTVRGVVRARTKLLSGAIILAELFGGYEAVGEPLQSKLLVSNERGAIAWPMTRPVGTALLRFSSGSPDYNVRISERLVVRAAEAPQDILLIAYLYDSRISGIVTDEKGAPIAAAKVLALYPDREVLTDEHGRYELKVGSVYRSYLRVIAKGYALLSKSIEIPRAGSHIQVSFRLERGIQIRGTVVDEAGSPILGVRVSTSQAPASTFVTTDALGAWTISWLSADSNSDSVIALKEGYLRATVGLRLSQIKASYELVLRRGGSIVGTVVDGESNPVAGAIVKLLRMGEHPRVTRSQKDGSFVFEHVAFIPYAFTVMAKGFAFVDRPSIMLPKKGAELRLDVVLQAGYSLTGVVINNSREPLVGVRIWFPTSIPTGRSIVTDVKGRFIVDGLPKSKVWMTFSKPGYVTREGVELAVNRRAVWIILQRAAFPTGRVIDAETKKPVISFLVVGIHPQLRAGERAVRTLAFGSGVRFENEKGEWRSKVSCSPGTIFAVRVIAKGYSPGRMLHAIVRSDSDPSDSVVELLPGGTVLGRVIDAASAAPISGAQVWYERADTPAHKEHYRTKTGPASSTMTDKNGKFRIDDVPGAELVLHVKHKNWPSCLDGPFLLLARQVSRREIRLKASAIIAGTLVGLDKKAVAATRIRLSAMDVPGVKKRTRWSTETDKNGKFRFTKNLAEGRYLLQLGDGQTMLRNVVISTFIQIKAATLHQITLGPHGSSEIAARLLASAPIATTTVWLTRENTDGTVDLSFPGHYFRCENGYARFRGLAAGIYRIETSLPNFGTGNVLVKITKGENKSVKVPLRR